jgi:hypothetical protein
VGGFGDKTGRQGNFVGLNDALEAIADELGIGDNAHPEGKQASGIAKAVARRITVATPTLENLNTEVDVIVAPISELGAGAHRGRQNDKGLGALVLPGP